MDFHWPNQNVDPFLLQPNSQDTFPLDMNSLFGFDDALFQEQNCTSSATYPAGNPKDSPHPAMSNLSQAEISPILSSDSPSSLSSGIGFDSMPPDLMTSAQNSPLNEWLLNPTTGEVIRSTEATDRDGSKRSRGEVDDNINACWKSPLCPNRKDDGSRPDSCRGECADYLFAHPAELPDDKKILSEMMAKSEPKVILETPSANRRLKRSEMESTPDVEGRTVTSTSPARGKNESLPSKSTIVSKKSPSPSRTQTTQMSSSLSTTTNTTTTSTTPSSQKPKGRVPHNQVEKKYRENVNAQLEALKRVVPVSKQQLVGFDGLDIEDLAMNTRQPSKAVVLSSATAYIKQLEKENKRLLEENAAIKEQNKTLQSLVKCDDCSLMNYARQWKIRGPV